MYQLPCSSATIRNEFALLEEVGFIASPHISSGKVPTKAGYRYYVDNILEEQLNTKTVHNTLQKHIKEYNLTRSKERICDVLRIITEATGNIAFASIDADQTLYLGVSSMLRAPEYMKNPELAARVIEIIEGRDTFQTLLNTLILPLHEVKIFIGEENILSEMSSCAMLVIRYESRSSTGKIGILGPMRLNYSMCKMILEEVLSMLE